MNVFQFPRILFNTCFKLEKPSCTFYATVNSKIGKRFNGKGRQKPYSVDVLGFLNVLLTFITTRRVVRAIFPVFYKYTIIQNNLLISKPTTICVFYDCTSLYLRLYTHPNICLTTLACPRQVCLSSTIDEPKLSSY